MPLHSVAGVMRVRIISVIKRTAIGRGARTVTGGDEADLDRPGLCEFEGDDNSLALNDRRRKLHQHEMEATGRQRHGLPGRDDNPVFQSAHRHHVVLHAHFVNFNASSRRAAGRNQLIIGATRVQDRDITATHRLIGQRRARECARQFQIAVMNHRVVAVMGGMGGSVLRDHRCSRKQNKRGKACKNLRHTRISLM